MNKETHLNSRQFVRLVSSSGGGGYVEGDYRFDTLLSGISLHGGTVTAKRDFCSSRLAEPYVSFVLLMEGGLDFGINRRDYHIDAEGGKIVLIAVDEEVLFSRYLYCGRKTVKITLKGAEQWLLRPEYAGFAPTLYREPVRVLPLDNTLRELGLNCLQPVGAGDLEAALQREADVLQLLAGLWHACSAHIGKEQGKGRNMPSERFGSRLDAAFKNGAQHVGGLVQALNIGERTLQRRMREQFGITASEWLHHKQMQNALCQLKNEGKSIGETAYLCGYRHVSSFTQAFRQYFGCTPAEVQKRQ